MIVPYGISGGDFRRQSSATGRDGDGVVLTGFALLAVLLVGVSLHWHSGSNAGRSMADAGEGAAGLHQFMLVP